MMRCKELEAHAPHDRCAGLVYIRRSAPGASSVLDDWVAVGPYADRRGWVPLVQGVLIALGVTLMIVACAAGIGVQFEQATRPEPARVVVPTPTPYPSGWRP